MNQWDENDAQFMFKVADDLAQEAVKFFAADLISNNSSNCRLIRSVFSGQSITPALKRQCLSLIDANLGQLYTKSFGDDWQFDKNLEMEEPGLVYLIYQEQDLNRPLSPEVMIFLSFMVTYNEGEKVLYLYEIHLHQRYQGRGLGSILLNTLHDLSASLSGYLQTSATSLTVFSANNRAFKWYQSMGYQLTAQSPRDRKLRGKIVQPDSYWLRRSNFHS